MPILKQSESTYTPAPPGAHPARCVSMISLGTQPPSNPKFSANFKVVLEFELPNELVEFNGKKMPMKTHCFLNAYLGRPEKPSKTNLFLTSWRGRGFTEEEMQRFDLKNVVGAPALLNIVHTSKDGKTRDSIASISPLPKGMEISGQVHPSVIYEIEEGQSEKFKALPPWIQKMISQCEEWTTPPAPAEEPQGSAPECGSGSDDVPF